MAQKPFITRFSLHRWAMGAAGAVAALLSTTGSSLGQERLEIEGLRAPVAVARDGNGIVHIFAANEMDMAEAQGWVHARDRLFQMDVLRRRASGTLAELFGPGDDNVVLESDVEMRTLGLRRAAACSLQLSRGCPFDSLRGLSHTTRHVLDAYARGVNAFVEATEGLPPEYGALNAHFVEWTPLDSVTVANGLAFELSFDLDDVEYSLALEAFVEAGAKNAKMPFNGKKLFFEDLYRSAPFKPVAVIPSKASAETAAAQGPAATLESAAAVRDRGAMSEAVRRYLERARKVPMLQKTLSSMRQFRGSNAWVVGGEKAKGGAPLLASDPHLDLTTPPLFYPIHLSARLPKVNAIGDGIAGVPFILTGRNLHVACGITSMPLDVTDFYKERVVLDLKSPTGLRIVHEPSNSDLDQIIAIPEVFRFKDPGGNIVVVPSDRVPPVTLVVPRRNFGPIVKNLGNREFLSVQYTGFGATRELDAYRALMKARNLNDVVNVLQLIDVGSQSFVCADSAGSIGYFVAGKVPLREDLQAGTMNGLPPFFVRDGTGANGSNEWLPIANPPKNQALPYQVIPFPEMPQVINPPEGYLISANNDPLGLNFDNNPLNTSRVGGGIYYLSPRYNPGFRAYRIKERLERRFQDGPVSFKDMQDIQADVVLSDAEFFLPFIIRSRSQAQAYSQVLGLEDTRLEGLLQDPAIDQAIRRLAAWDRSAPTGVEKGYDAHHDDGDWTSRRDSSVAATIYAVWRGQFIRNTIIRTLNDVGLGDFDPTSQQLLTAVKNLLDHPERGGVGVSGLNFYRLPEEFSDVVDPGVRRDILILLSLKSALDLLKGPAFADAFDNSPHQRDYLWGRVHRLVIDHPLGDRFSLTGDWEGNPFRPPFEKLSGVPVDGALGTVDAASHSAKANTLEDFEFGQGPLRRFVTSLDQFRRTESSLPGGVSGERGSPYFNNLLGSWLNNETFRWRQVSLRALKSDEVVILTPPQSSSD